MTLYLLVKKFHGQVTTILGVYNAKPVIVKPNEWELIEIVSTESEVDRLFVAFKSEEKEFPVVEGNLPDGFWIAGYYATNKRKAEFYRKAILESGVLCHIKHYPIQSLPILPIGDNSPFYITP